MGHVSVAEIASLLAEHDDFVICGHVSPDGDCLGSQLGLARALRSCGKNVTCLLAQADPIDHSYRFLPGIDDMVVAEQFSGKVGMFVTVDVPTADRMGKAAAELHSQAPATLTIDHHIAQGPFSAYEHIEEEASATALIVWDIAKQMGCADDADVALCCYTGIVSDTGRFQYQNTDARSLVAAAEMVQAGADPAYAAREIYQSRSRQSLALEGRMLSRMELLCDGAFAISYLLRSDFVETGAQKSDAEPLIDVLRSVRGIRVACMLREQQGSVRGSLRAKDDTDVAAIAAAIGGGGHRAAAGFTFKGSMDDARALMARTLRDLDA